MKRILLLLAAIFLVPFILFAIFIGVLSLFNDDSTYYWEFNQPVSEVSKIEIIEFVDYAGEYEVRKTLDIKYAEELCNDISSLMMEKYGTNLINPYGYGFKITFINGEYDIIVAEESEHYSYNQEYSQYMGYITWLRFDSSYDFYQLIIKYALTE